MVHSYIACTVRYNCIYDNRLFMILSFFCFRQSIEQHNILVVGPDFLDAMHHEASIEAAVGARKKNVGSKRARKRKTINLDGWMMGGEKAVLDCFLRHCGRFKDNNNNNDGIDNDDDDER